VGSLFAKRLVFFGIHLDWRRRVDFRGFSYVPVKVFVIRKLTDTGAVSVSYIYNFSFIEFLYFRMGSGIDLCWSGWGKFRGICVRGIGMRDTKIGRECLVYVGWGMVEVVEALFIHLLVFKLLYYTKSLSGLPIRLAWFLQIFLGVSLD
jgi:hypothetical protein